MKSFGALNYMKDSDRAVLHAVDAVSKELTARNVMPAFLYSWCTDRFETWPGARGAQILAARLLKHGWAVAKKTVNCKHCKGVGTEDEECWECAGTGTVDYDALGRTLKIPVICSVCNGTKITKEPCIMCDGAKQLDIWVFDPSIKPVITENW